MSQLAKWGWMAVMLSFVFVLNVHAQDTPESTLPSLPTSANQVLDPSAFALDIDTVATDIGTLSDADLTGFNTYRLYVEMSSPEDQLSAVYGNIASPSALLTSGSFFQSSPIGTVTAAGIFPEAWQFYPSNQFDSFVTIGIDGPASTADNEGTVQTQESSANPWIPVFEPEVGTLGNGFELNDLVGGTWFVVSSYSNGIAGDDERVLIAQLTTDGTLSGNLHVQILLGGNADNIVYLNLPIPVYGCTDDAACNYDVDATDDDGTCLDSDAIGVCGGDCSADLDSDGLCDDVDDCVGELDDCGICNGPGAIYDCGCSDIPAGDCDCEGNQLDALGVCGGDCAADLDGDGICDDVDACVGELDDCGICNGPGAIYDCGCSGIPAGDCDCDGNQLDALGVCGGDCAADLDSDGICDDVDDCVGDYDDCGICNGPGAIYDCGCANTPVGDCDCDGNQLDALGICGGDCASDVDGDGICDTDEIAGCTDQAACNFNPNATDDDGSCQMLDAIGVCGGSCVADLDGDGVCNDVDFCVGEFDECGVCNGPGAVYECGCAPLPPGDCDCDGNELDVLGICGGGCTADLDGDGLCDDIDDCVGAEDDCGICNGPGAIYDCGCEGIPAGDCDCDGNQLDALGVCGGDCTADVDGDGICDDVDDCIGQLDDCGICNGPGAIYDCGCDDIPAGDCDCNGNQLDAIGLCGGSCEADVDGDGVCDDVDFCIGEFDECGICNGPGAIYECGCANIPVGDCDCDGNQLDALGVCGGDCASDIDGDGVCDTDEIPGCTDEAATNFNGFATDDDGSCSYAGCTDPTAENYAVNATEEDGSCEYLCIGTAGCTYPGATNYNADANCENGTCEFPPFANDLCMFDLDGNGVVGAADLIVFLGVYELSCEEITTE